LVCVRAAGAAFLPEYARHAVLPYGVIAINFTLAFLGICGVRAGRRLLSERSKADSRRRRDMAATPTLLIGAGQGGISVAKQIENRPELGLLALGFLDDDLS
jgi:FlaA1/EpsC-like NDP-sugar epimerase